MWREAEVLLQQNVTKCKVIIRIDLLAGNLTFSQVLGFVGI